MRWGDDPYPDETTQVMVADDPGDRGLFFRVAPVSFLGSSLVSGHGGCDPFEAAALGSAVLYGPKVRNFLPSYGRLATAGAARIVNDAGALGNAVSRLIAPDQAATMAHAGWDVISEGAELADRVIEMVQDRLDEEMGASDARA
jgi:3-deoxy-D-manno-octulosonic-acid transferase